VLYPQVSNHLLSTKSNIVPGYSSGGDIMAEASACGS
jgi:hypothetical protein